MYHIKEKSPFLREVSRILRVKHYAYKTEQTYVDWIKRYILFHNKRHPQEMGEKEVADFLSYLTIKRNVSPTTQSQALNALVFLYRHVIERPLGDISGIVRSKKKPKMPTVLTTSEVKSILDQLSGVHWLIVCLLYGSGLRLMECMTWSTNLLQPS